MIQVIIETLVHVHDNLEQWVLFYAELAAKGDPYWCKFWYDTIMSLLGGGS